MQVFLIDWLSELRFNACLSVFFFSQLLLLTNAGLKCWPRGLYRIYGQKDSKIETLALRTLTVCKLLKLRRSSVQRRRTQTERKHFFDCYRMCIKASRTLSMFVIHYLSN